MTDEEWVAFPVHIRTWAIERAQSEGHASDSPASELADAARAIILILDPRVPQTAEQQVDFTPAIYGWKADRGLV